jgi:hypothetical protein
MVRPSIRSRQNYHIGPNPNLSVTNVLGSVPAMIRRYALSDEQLLRGIVRHNRLIDVFTGSVCYSLDGSLRTFLPGLGEVETGEIYVGLTMTGKQYVFPLQARGPNDTIETVQVERDLAVCASKFPTLVCCPIGAQLIDDNLIALFEFVLSDGEVSIKDERHYRLVHDDDLINEPTGR